MEKLVRYVASTFAGNASLSNQYAEHFVVALYAALTHAGKKYQEEFLVDKPLKGNPKLQELINCTNSNHAVLVEPPEFKFLDTREIPRFRSSILSVLTETDLLFGFFLPMMKSGKENWIPLITVTTIYITFYLHVLEQIPELDYSEITGNLIIGYQNVTNKQIKNPNNENMLERIELETIIIDYLSACLLYPDDESISSAIKYIFEWTLVRNFINCQGVRQLIPRAAVIPLPTARPTIYELFMKSTLTTNMFFLKDQSHPLYKIATFNLIAILQLSVNLTSQIHYSVPVGVFLSEQRFKHRLFHEYVLLFCNSVPRFQRKIKGLIFKLKLNLSYIIPKMASLNLMTTSDFKSTLGTDSIYIDKEFIIDLLSSNIFIPSMNLHFLNFTEYLIDTYILFKASVAFSLWESIRLTLLNDPSSNGQIFPISSRTISPDCVLVTQKTDEIIDAEKFVLINQQPNGIEEISFAQYISNTDDMTFKCNILCGRAGSFNKLFVLDPATLSSYSTLDNVIKLFIELPEISDKSLSHIWLGNNRIKSISSLQMSLEREMMLDEIHLDNTIPNQIDLVKALSELNNIGTIFHYECGKSFEKEAVVSIPASSGLKTRLEFYDSSREKILPENIHLTPAQQAALLSSLFFPLTLIVGPPGTGKTETMLAIAKVIGNHLSFEVNAKGKDVILERILICAHSNAALDQMIDDLIDDDDYVFRFGQRPTTERTTGSTAEGRIINMIKEAKATLTKIRIPEVKETSDLFDDLSSFEFNDIRDMLDSYRELFNDHINNLTNTMGRYIKYRNEISSIIKTLRLFSNPFPRIVHKMIKHRAILGCTISGLAMRIDQLKNLKISTIIVEEAAKVLETEMLPFLLLQPSRFIVIGDQEQLTPIITCDDVRLTGRFSQSLFERLQRLDIKSIILNKQGRAKREIADLYRDRYPVPIQDHKFISKLPVIPFIDPIVQWVDVRCETQGKRCTNPIEANFIVQLLRFMKLRKFDLQKISVLTPYNNQKSFLIDLIEREGLEPRDICTVDEFQGLQNLVILISTVSSSPSIWLRDRRRITVLISRSRCSLIFFGNRNGFINVPEWRPVIEAVNKTHNSGKLRLAGKDHRTPNELKMRNDSLTK